MPQLHITSLASHGDGLAEHDGKRLYVPYTLTGETVEAEIQGDYARLTRIIIPGPDRRPARCPHYTHCGGCSLQHLPEAAYTALKRDLVAAALSHRGIDFPVESPIPVPERTRRRAAFAAHRTPSKESKSGVALGFHAARTHTIIPITDCAVITPALQSLLPKLEHLAALAAPRKDALALTATETATGIDLALTGAPRDLSADTKLKLTEAAMQVNLARLSLNGDVLIERTPPTLRIGAAHLSPPPGGFLQATEPSQSAMIRFVTDALAGSKRIVDLFSGSGTFSLPLAAIAPVHAVESEQPALAALEAAARRAPNLKPVTTEKRDLFRRPLTSDDLARFDAAVIDPPRAGAEAQSQQLAKSKVKRLAMVSCNPGTFARDLKLLLDAGWNLTRVTPVDQFLYAPHVEIVASLTR